MKKIILFFIVVTVFPAPLKPKNSSLVSYFICQPIPLPPPAPPICIDTNLRVLQLVTNTQPYHTYAMVTYIVVGQPDLYNPYNVNIRNSKTGKILPYGVITSFQIPNFNRSGIFAGEVAEYMMQEVLKDMRSFQNLELAAGLVSFDDNIYGQLLQIYGFEYSSAPDSFYRRVFMLKLLIESTFN